MTDENSSKKIPRILVVDDDQDILLTLKLVLETNNFLVDAIGDPLLALENFKTGFYDLLIIDVKMAKMNGIEFYKNIRKIDPRVKSCFLTALGELAIYENQLNEVIPDPYSRIFLKKPIDNDQLIKQVKSLLS
jgi:two-component SAPR family response regulator